MNTRLCARSPSPPRSALRPASSAKHLAGIALSLLVACASPVRAAGTDAVAPCQARNLDFGQKSVRWAHQPLSKLKRDTSYTLALEDGQTILRANADRSASMYVTLVDKAAGVPATVSWRWKTDALVPGADNRDKSREDAPLRVMVAFDGDPSTLPEVEQKRLARAKSMSGRNIPYAVLMYIWSEQVPLDTVIPSAHTSQVKMLVAATGTADLGRWQSLRRDVRADYRRAYGADPGRVLGIGVMTDTDNTATKASGDYAQIRLACGPG
jgi:hypothetical protein